ncbi:NlpC/P60 family protein [Falsirhodobacter algicola]|uniref:Peptidase n=1 Tax=Falsirhodobacter algicola TaxID=2692330 RepID=A0A8J8MR23_9RHOB|nr:NlpC/P60 family protein [Falsirhodobacter algicola]QUS35160.1 peptidase [Falsirhodobacter algicola]
MNAVVTEARAWIGTPYVHQAACRGAGTDCLGLIRGVWRALMGHEPEAVPAYTQDWSEPSGEEVLMQAAGRWLVPRPAGPPDPGDVLLFRMRDAGVAKHLGIVSGPDRFIHAYTGHGVTESPLSAPWARRIAARFAFPERI